LCTRERFAADSDESLSLLSAPVRLDGGVGGLGIGANPLLTARWGSLRICVSRAATVSGADFRIGACDSETVI
jgi:hypothetical protein